MIHFFYSWPGRSADDLDDVAQKIFRAIHSLKIGGAWLVFTKSRSHRNSYLKVIDSGNVRMSDMATLSSKFQVSVPKAVREAQAWKAGQEFVFIPKGKGVLLMPVPRVEDLRGIAKGADPRDYRDRSDRY